MDPDAWARAHKKNIAREFIRKIGYNPSQTPAGIFTAGLPGAGKTEFTKELLKDIADKPLRIDMDEIACLIEGYNPRTASHFRAGAVIILEKIYDEVIKAGLDFVFDGTFSHAKALDNVQRAITKGYTVKIYFIHQDPLIAWRFTKDRELVEQRAIDREGFINTYYKFHANVKKLQDTYEDVTISVIIKDGENRVGRRIENVKDVYDFVPKPLARDMLSRDILE